MRAAAVTVTAAATSDSDSDSELIATKNNNPPDAATGGTGGATGAGSSGRKINLGGDKWVTVRVKNRNPNQPQVIVTGKIGDNAADTLSAIGS